MATRSKTAPEPAAPETTAVSPTAPYVTSGNGDAQRNQAYGSFFNTTIPKPWLTAFSVVDHSGKGTGIAWKQGPGSFSVSVTAPAGNGKPGITVGAPQTAEDAES